ncbi:hypothetical protein, partial [Xenorhabdus bovienii]|uniref:hypothetical protein n=1 Tax=Xenorhabdus bovienii TaxID=40576 RepID=UPI003DA2992A
FAYNSVNPIINYFIHNNVIVNNQKYQSIMSCMDRIEQIIDNYIGSYNRIQKSVLCHGDPHAGNIIATAPESGMDVLLIDPRGRFMNSSAFFSPIYDEGKILHDIFFEYSNIISGNFISSNYEDSWFISRNKKNFPSPSPLTIFKKI